MSPVTHLHFQSWLAMEEDKVSGWPELRHQICLLRTWAQERMYQGGILHHMVTLKAVSPRQINDETLTVTAWILDL